VNSCLQHKPDDVPVEKYFQEHLEPLLSKLAVECLSSKPENPVAFVQSWVSERELEGRLHEHLSEVPSTAGVPLTLEGGPLSPIALMATWRDQ
ncbi:unnamed protein product, partial [Polarella glacialis]